MSEILPTETLNSFQFQEQEILTPEDEVRLEVAALLGAYVDVHANDELTQQQKNERDNLIFSGLKQSVERAESLQNIALLGNIRAQILAQEANCNHASDGINAFNDLLNERGVFGEQNDSHKEDDKKDPKTRKKKKRSYGWFLLSI